MNARQHQMLNNYNSASAETLPDVYARCSENKKRAYNHCLQIQAEKRGFYGRITSANCHQFTYAFLYRDSAKRLHLHYITASNEYDFIID